MKNAQKKSGGAGWFGVVTTLLVVLQAAVPALAQGGGSMQQLPGCQHFWTFDGTPKDSHGNADAFLVNNATYQDGLVGLGLNGNGNGTPDCAKVPASLFRFDPQWTMELSVKAVSAGSTPDVYGSVVFEQHGPSPTPVGVSLAYPGSVAANAGFFTLTINVSAVPVPQQVQIRSANAYPLGQWHHVIVTWNSPNLSLWVDGALAAFTTTAGTILTPTGPGSELTFGRATVGASRSFHGVIDEVRYYDRELTSCELTSLFSAGSAAVARPSHPDQLPVPFGLDAHFRGDGTPMDSLSGLTATAVGAVSYTPGVSSTAFQFPGTSPAYLQVPAALPVQPSTLTAMAWAWSTPPAGPSNNTIMVKRHLSGSASYRVYGIDGQGRFGGEVTLSNGMVVSVVGTSRAQALWHHVALTWDGLTLRLYINGLLDASTAPLSSPLGISYAGAGPLEIGGEPSASDSHNGRIDEVMVLTGAMSAADVAGIAANGSGSIRTGSINAFNLVATTGPARLEFSKPLGPGSLTARVMLGMPAPVGAAYFSLFTFNSFNANCGLGFGPIAGLFITPYELVGQLTTPHPLYQGLLDPAGCADFSVPAGTLTPYAGLTVYGVTLFAGTPPNATASIPAAVRIY